MFDAKIENWQIVQCTKKEFVIYGTVFEDCKGRFDDGVQIKTSGIRNRPCKEGDIVKTRNSSYMLGKQLDK